MKVLIIGAALTAISVGPAVFAQSQTSNSQMSNSQVSANSGHLAAAQQIQQDLKNAGFTNVKVVAESFVVQAKSKNGDPVVMTIGPHGMSVFEAMNGTNSGSSSQTTGSSAPSSSYNSNGSSNNSSSKQ